MLRNFIAVAVVTSLLQGCAAIMPGIESNVKVFHQMPTAQTADATYSILPWRKEHEGSLEHDAYAQQVATWLRLKNLNVVSLGAPAKFAVYLDFGIDDGRTESVTYSQPQWGVTGYGSSTTTGTVNRIGNTSYVNATTTVQPTYGVTGFNQVTDSTRVYRRFVSIDIVEVGTQGGPTPKKIYQGQLKSEGSCGNLPAVMPSFLQALLSDFPGTSGTSRKVKLPWSGQC